MTNHQRYKQVLDAANAKYEAAQETARAAYVPKSDLDGEGEPTTVSGWYHQPTKSGRPAWQYRFWSHGRPKANKATYDRDAEEALTQASLEQYDAQRDYELDRRSPWRNMEIEG